MPFVVFGVFSCIYAFECFKTTSHFGCLKTTFAYIYLLNHQLLSPFVTRTQLRGGGGGVQNDDKLYFQRILKALSFVFLANSDIKVTFTLFMFKRLPCFVHIYPYLTIFNSFTFSGPYSII